MRDARRRLLGQYFTPAPVLDFALDALAWLDQDGPPIADRRLIDPACGPGETLWLALDKGLVRPENAFGLDMDETMPGLWLQRQGGWKQGPWLDVGDGLTAVAARGRSVREGTFDWVVGNPPYSSHSLKQATREYLAALWARYELCRLRYPDGSTRPDLLRGLPTEIPFIERFWQLCRPGGLFAVVLPVGIFANTCYRYLREWLLERTTVLAVVGLPRSTFRSHRTTAKTCLLIARKSPAPPGHQVLLAEVSALEDDQRRPLLREVLQAWMDGADRTDVDRPWARSLGSACG